MPLLGSLIKTAISVTEAFNLQNLDALEAQKKQLKSLLQQANSTAFGLYHGFDEILQASSLITAYQAHVPIVDYHQLDERWWHQQQKFKDITWPGKPDYFALSSGTTGKESKRIPVTSAMLDCFRSVGMAQVSSLAHFDLPSELFEKDVLMLSSSADLDQNNGHLEGEISGINTSNLPTWFGGFYKPGKDIAEIDNWDERVAAIIKKAPEWDVGAIAGIPSWIHMMLEAIVEHYQLDSIHDIWPSLSLYASGGVAFEPYRESLEQLMAKPLIYLDTYLASEGFFAFTSRPGTMNMQLMLNHGIFYEFIPFDERGFDEQGNLLAEPEVLHIGQVEEGLDYALLVSTPAGAWRYLIGDTIKFTDLEKGEMLISGRTKYFLNVAGSQLSEQKINSAITDLATEMEVEINEFAVAALSDGEGRYYHQWILGTTLEAETEEVAKRLDEQLKSLNKNYRVAREKALSGIKVKIAPTEQLYNWLEQTKKKGGQIKMPKVMKAEKMQDLLEFLKKELV